jgi:hypothetical protein
VSTTATRIHGLTFSSATAVRSSGPCSAASRRPPASSTSDVCATRSAGTSSNGRTDTHPGQDQHARGHPRQHPPPAPGPPTLGLPHLGLPHLGLPNPGLPNPGTPEPRPPVPGPPDREGNPAARGRPAVVHSPRLRGVRGGRGVAHGKVNVGIRGGRLHSRPC